MQPLKNEDYKPFKAKEHSRKKFNQQKLVSRFALVASKKENLELKPFIKIHSISKNRADEKFIQEVAVASL
jgi:hypothetical protein